MVDKGPARVFLNENGILRVPCNEAFPYRHGIGHFLFEKMSECKDKVAQIDSITEEQDTYGSLLRKCVLTAITMRSKGITPKDIVTVCSSNHINTCVPLVACFFLGVKYANTDPNLSVADTVFLLEQVRPKMVFVSTNGVNLIEDALKETGIDAQIVVFGNSSKHSQFADFLVESAEEDNFVPFQVADITETAAIVFSSGTTGLPKGICVTHKGYLAQILHERTSVSANSFTLLAYSSAYWVTLLPTLLFAAARHGCRIITPGFNVSEFWNLIQRYKVTVAKLYAAHVATLCKQGRPGGVDTSSLMEFFCGGNAILGKTIVTMRSMLPHIPVVAAYGLSEVGGRAIYFNLSFPEDLQLAIQKPSSSGRPAPGYHIKVVDPETENVLGPNQHGELRLKTDYQMNGYYNMDSSSGWDSDGYLKTGDLAYYDEDYCFYILARIKEMFKYQGWQIVPAKLEAVLMTHHAVESAAVIGVAHPFDGDHPMGIVSLGKSYVGIVTAKEIEKYVEERVNAQEKLRGGVKIVTSIPRTPAGKLRKKYLTDLVLAGKL